MTTSLDTFLQLARRDDQDGFSGLWGQLASPLTQFMAASGSAQPEAQCNEVIRAAFHGLDGFRGDAGSFRCWVFAIARRRLDGPHRSSRQVRPDPSDDLISDLHDQWVRETLARLSPEQRQLILLRVVAGLTELDVARILGRSATEVRCLQRLALARLETCAAAGPRKQTDRPGQD